MLKTRFHKIIFIFFIIFFIGCGFLLSDNIRQPQAATAEDFRLDDQEATIRAIKKIKPAVVSIIIYDYDSALEIGTVSGEIKTPKKRMEKQRGTGFIISEAGYILTNKHVVSGINKKTAEYRVILNSGKEYYAQFIAEDPAFDLAVLKIFDKDLPFVELGDSDKLEVGTTVLAIGNALGRYENSVTKGIVSGLDRSVSASDGGKAIEQLDNVIQTDAKINHGNSGGPLADLYGKVVGINTAIEEAGSAIGFAIPINDAKVAIASIIKSGKIDRPYLGVYYLMLTPQIALDNKLMRASGAWITTDSERNATAIIPGSPAEKAGLMAGDIIFEINAKKIEGTNTLLSVIQSFLPGQKIGLKIQRNDKIIIKIVELGNMQ